MALKLDATTSIERSPDTATGAPGAPVVTVMDGMGARLPLRVSTMANVAHPRLHERPIVVSVAVCGSDRQS